MNLMKIALIVLAAIISMGCESENTAEPTANKTIRIPLQNIVKSNGLKSELFKKGTLVYSDDFDGEWNKKYLSTSGEKSGVKDGMLIMAPRFESKEVAMKVLKRDHHLGLGVVGHLNNLPEKFILHMRYKVITDAIVPGRPSFQIGHHMMSLSYNKDGGYHLGLPGEKRVRFSEPNAEMKINEWVDLVIEYQKGKMLLSVNGHSKIYEHDQVSMENKKSGPKFSFKSKDRIEERILFDSIKLWEVE